MSTLSSQMLDGEDFVDCCYHVQTYLMVYDPCIYPVNGPEKWSKTSFEPLLPPNPGRQVGRPARARRLEVDERPRKTKKGTTVEGTRLKRQQQTLKCRFYGETSHNKKGCQMRKDAEAMIRDSVTEEDAQNQSQSQTEISFQMSQTNVVSQSQTSLPHPETSKLTARKRILRGKSMKDTQSTQNTLLLHVNKKAKCTTQNKASDLGIA
ncbi:UNVERIFIED_CONTAM: hypothetical protein Slati_0096400 [Sesamum latifolium]|uniref:Uncharacterized protein n=1 Tax=Sesamum latifolium TaxID=2727402 RepID=A0AAW2Y8G0_9LAMI